MTTQLPTGPGEFLDPTRTTPTGATPTGTRRCGDSPKPSPPVVTRAGRAARSTDRATRAGLAPRRMSRALLAAVAAAVLLVVAPVGRSWSTARSAAARAPPLPPNPAPAVAARPYPLRRRACRR